jgi:hypothetical protein
MARYLAHSLATHMRFLAVAQLLALVSLLKMVLLNLIQGAIIQFHMS